MRLGLSRAVLLNDGGNSHAETNNVETTRSIKKAERIKANGIWSRPTMERRKGDGSKVLHSTAEHAKTDIRAALAGSGRLALYERAFQMACEMKGRVIDESSGIQARKRAVVIAFSWVLAKGEVVVVASTDSSKWAESRRIQGSRRGE